MFLDSCVGTYCSVPDLFIAVPISCPADDFTVELFW
jgi:hypothetical protein